MQPAQQVTLPGRRRFSPLHAAHLRLPSAFAAYTRSLLATSARMSPLSNDTVATQRGTARDMSHCRNVLQAQEKSQRPPGATARLRTQPQCSSSTTLESS